MKFEVIDSFVVVAVGQLNYLIREATAWYNTERPHSSRNHFPPICDKPPYAQAAIKMSEVLCTTRLG